MADSQSNKIEQVCVTCGKKFLAKPFEVKHGRGRFCSVACRSVDLMTRIELTCENCGNPFFAVPCQFERSRVRFCSKPCRQQYEKAQLVERICESCGKSFLVNLKKNRGRFCSRSCFRKLLWAPLKERFYKYVGEKDKNGCILWIGGTSSDGYGIITQGGGANRKLFANRVAWELSNGPIPEGMSVLHKCDNPPCVNPDHLFLGTQDRNMKDAASKDRMKTKISREQVEEIRNLYGTGKFSQKELAIQFGISQANISCITTMKTRISKSIKR